MILTTISCLDAWGDWTNALLEGSRHSVRSPAHRSVDDKGKNTMEEVSGLRSVMVALAFALVACGAAHAQGYPQKPIRLVIPLAPGGGNDTLARYVARQMTDGLGQPIVVENRPGGGGLVGGEFVARAPPDGYTLVFSGSGLTVATLAYGKLDMRKD